MNILMLKSLFLNNSKHILRSTEQVALNQVRFQSSLGSFNGFATDSKSPIPPIDDVNNKALKLVQKLHSNPYALFVQKQFKETKEKNPEMKSKNVIQALSTTWKSMSFDEKLAYLDDASKQRQEKKAELANLFKTKEEALSFDRHYKEVKSMRRKHLGKIRIKKEKILLKKPKKPVSAFFLFQKTLDRGEAPVIEFVKGASQKWKAMPVQEKEKFEMEAREMNEQYKNDLREWESKMLAQGKQKLVSKAFIKSIKLNLKKSEPFSKIKIKPKNKAQKVKKNAAKVETKSL